MKNNLTRHCSTNLEWSTDKPRKYSDFKEENNYVAENIVKNIELAKEAPLPEGTSFNPLHLIST